MSVSVLSGTSTLVGRRCWVCEEPVKAGDFVHLIYEDGTPRTVHHAEGDCCPESCREEPW